MHKKNIFSLLWLLANIFFSTVFGEGFTSNTLVAQTIFGSEHCFSSDKAQVIADNGMRYMAHTGQGFYAYSLSPEGKIVFGKIVKKETRSKFVHWELNIEGGTQIYADYNQRFYCPNRGEWVKLKDLVPGQDMVFSLTKGLLGVLDHHRVNTAYSNIKVELHRISVEKYENYFVSKDLILVHNFVPLVVPMASFLAGHAADFVVNVGLALVTGYLAEKVSEKIIPLVQDALHGSQKVGESGTSVVPKIDAENKENKPSGPQNTPPPDDDYPPSTPVFRKGEPKPSSKLNFKDTVINGIKFTHHAIQRMVERGIPPSVVTSLIQRAKQGAVKSDELSIIVDPKNASRLQLYDKINKITVIAENTLGKIISVFHNS